MGACPRCKHDHPPVSFTAWAWAMRDYKPKPPLKQLAVIFILGTRLDPATGCGWTTREQIMADTGVEKDTVTRATAWAAGHLLLLRLRRGHRLWDGTASGTLWALADPRNPETAAYAQQRSTASLSDTRAQDSALDTPTSRAQHSAVEKAHKGAGQRPQGRSAAPLSKTRSVRPSKKTTGYGSHIGESSATADNGSAGRDRALDFLAAQIHASHLAACKTSLPRALKRQHGEYISELIVHGHHEPGHVEQALARWREIRDRGDPVSLRTLDNLLDRIERAAARAQVQNVTEDGGTVTWAVQCDRCLELHPDDQPCPR